MGALLVLVGFGGLIFGLMNLVRPMGLLKVTTRGTAGLVAVGSFVVLALGGALLPPSEETPTAAGASTTTSLPSVPQADVLFGTPTDGPSGDPLSPLDAEAKVATVLSITDGETFDVELEDGSTDTVRLIGVNAPGRDECWGEEASLVLETLTPVGNEVGLTWDVSARDGLGRLLRYVWVGGMSVNEELVRRGAAISRRYPPDTSLAERFESAQADAEANSLGLWAPDACGSSADASIDIVEIAFDAPGNDNENLNGEWITVFNNGDSSVEMTGWGIHDESATNRYTFPPGFTLAAGATVSVFSGCGEDSDDALYWCSQGSGVWNNDGDTVFITDPLGNRHTSQMYEPPTTTTTSSLQRPLLNQQRGRQL